MPRYTEKGKANLTLIISKSVGQIQKIFLGLEDARHSVSMMVSSRTPEASIQSDINGDFTTWARKYYLVNGRCSNLSVRLIQKIF